MADKKQLLIYETAFKGFHDILTPIGKHYVARAKAEFPALNAIGQAYFNIHPEGHVQTVVDVNSLRGFAAIELELLILMNERGVPRSLRNQAERLFNQIESPGFRDWLYATILEHNARFGETTPIERQSANPAQLQLPGIKRLDYRLGPTGPQVAVEFERGTNAVNMQMAVVSAFYAAGSTVSVNRDFERSSQYVIVNISPSSDRLAYIKLRQAAYEIAQANGGVELSTTVTRSYPHPNSPQR
jgi:hypothetical protein